MYTELEKYNTKQKGETVGVLPDGKEIKIYLDVFEFPLGDLINDFIEHKKVKFVNRKPYHQHLGEIYLKALNQLTVKYNI